MFVGSRELNASEFAVSYEGEEATLSLSVSVKDVPARSEVCVIVDGGLQIAADPKVGDAYRFLLQAQVPYRGKEMAFDAVRDSGGSASAIAEISTLEYENESEAEKYRNSVDMLNAYATDQPSVVKWAQWRCTLPVSVKHALEEILLRSVE